MAGMCGSAAPPSKDMLRQMSSSSVDAPAFLDRGSDWGDGAGAVGAGAVGAAAGTLAGDVFVGAAVAVCEDGRTS